MPRFFSGTRQRALHRNFRPQRYRATADAVWFAVSSRILFGAGAMADLPSHDLLAAAFVAADAAHDEYERAVLKGLADSQWAGFYAAYVLGRLGEFVTAGRLSLLLEEVAADTDWADAAADHVLVKLRS